jgi:hypothetical protein
MTTKYTKWPYSISNGRKIDQMVIKYTNIFNCKTLQNLPKLGFLVWKQTIWQPWWPAAEERTASAFGWFIGRLQNIGQKWSLSNIFLTCLWFSFFISDFFFARKILPRWKFRTKKSSDNDANLQSCVLVLFPFFQCKALALTINLGNFFFNGYRWECCPYFGAKNTQIRDG